MGIVHDGQRVMGKKLLTARDIYGAIYDRFSGDLGKIATLVYDGQAEEFGILESVLMDSSDDSVFVKRYVDGDPGTKYSRNTINQRRELRDLGIAFVDGNP